MRGRASEADWWIDESFYPGPDYHQFAFQFRYGKTLVVSKSMFDIIIKRFEELGVTASKITKYIEDLYVLPSSPKLKKLNKDGLPMTVRERSLYLQKNRNTGPQNKRAFSRDGRKVY
jgi:hypothetical protein